MVECAGYAAEIQRKLKANPIVAILGPRQAGKTTLARSLALPGAVDCYLACCAQHDRCFRKHHCRAGNSWPQIFCPTKCGHCARQVLGCYAGCLFGGNGPKVPPYYCAKLDRYYYNWDDIPAECFQNENGNKPPKPDCYP